MKNYQDIYQQVTNHGLRISGTLVVGKLTRCKVTGDKERRGWYSLYEMHLDNGDVIGVGSYGIWQGTDNGYQKIELKFDYEFSKEQQAAMRKRMADDKKRLEAEAKRRHEQASQRAESIWRNKLAPIGSNDYLTRKGIQPHGVKFGSNSQLVIPVTDVKGKIWGLQLIYDSVISKETIAKKGRDKDFFPTGFKKRGNFYLIGLPSDTLLVAEGYATAATLHEATGLPVAVAFDANNLDPVIAALKKHYRHINILICADDDSLAKCSHCQTPISVSENPLNCPSCNKPHKRKNAGVDCARNAAMAHNCQIIVPIFNDEAARLNHFRSNKGKLTDFNDLMHVESLSTVRIQIESALMVYGWLEKAGQGKKQGGGESDHLPDLISSVHDVLDNYTLVSGMDSVMFDHKFRRLMPISEVQNLCRNRDIIPRWKERSDRRAVLPENVGFDPACSDPKVLCNLWGGFEMQPVQGDCECILGLLKYMCLEDPEMYNWMLKWLAYPLQYPGAKMKSALVVHGAQGTGKNMFFECVMRIYGQYGRIITQDAIEDKFNDWASKKLFLIADEVVARSDLYHIKNKLKSFITSDEIRINPKNMSSYTEQNHVNMVFLSNERMPVVLEEDDRRHAVIWTPLKLNAEYYEEVAAEIKKGGIEALYHYLLYDVDLSNFNEHSKPPMTKAKEDLINLSKDSTLRFYEDWVNQELGDIALQPALSNDVYEVYKHWCSQEGVRAVPKFRFIDYLVKRCDVSKVRKRFVVGMNMTANALTFLVPKGSPEQNPAVSEAVWFGKMVENFKVAMKGFKGVAYD